MRPYEADYEIQFNTNTGVNVIKNSVNQMWVTTDTDVNVTDNALDEDLEMYYSNNVTVFNNTRKRPAHRAHERCPRLCSPSATTQ